MIDWLYIPVALLYFFISIVLFLFGMNFVYLSFISWLRGRDDQSQPKLTVWPSVTVQLPIYNEYYVAERVIKAAANLEYPSELLEIQVLDDSTDETSHLVKQAIEQEKEKGVNIVHLHRLYRTGFKAGALQAGLLQANGEFIAILDADFVPAPDFLTKTLSHIVSTPKVAFVQTRWGHLNRDYSWLTYLQSLAIDAHFMVEQFARSQSGYWFNFNGTAGIWRRKALIDAGGWRANTLTEDLDLSYRAYLHGWKGRYVADIEVPAELPVSFSAFRRQQHRWARGSLECARKLLPQVWRAPISSIQKIQATLHLTGYSVHILLFLLTLIYPLVSRFTAAHQQFSNLYGLAYIFALSSLAPTLFFITGQQRLKRPWWRLLPKILLVSVMGSGLMVNTVRAALEIIWQPAGVFERTAKFGIGQKNQDWTQMRYQLRFDPVVYAELALGLFSMATACYAARLETWGIACFAGLFGSGLVMAAVVTVIQAIAVYNRRRERAIHSIVEKKQARAPIPSEEAL